MNATIRMRPASAILLDLVDVCHSMLARPYQTGLAEKVSRLMEEAEALAAAAPSSAPFLRGGAPVLADCIARLLSARDVNRTDEATLWEVACGAIVGIVRAEARAALAVESEILRERPVR